MNEPLRAILSRVSISALPTVSSELIEPYGRLEQSI